VRYLAEWAIRPDRRLADADGEKYLASIHWPNIYLFAAGHIP
jgi:hypothetical protein